MAGRLLLILVVFSICRLESISGFLLLVALLVGGGLCLVGLTMLLRESLPALTENLSDLSERDVGVVGDDVRALLIGKEHVGRESTLWRVGILLGLPGSPGLGSASAGGGGLLLWHLEFLFWRD